MTSERSANEALAARAFRKPTGWALPAPARKPKPIPLTTWPQRLTYGVISVAAACCLAAIVVAPMAMHLG